jgi:peptidoglycan/xylan/chitin deacetylase (PgdA/CDA1 family)
VSHRALGLLLALLATGAQAASAQPTIVSLEFDDGTSDQLQALPLLASAHMSATFFVNSALIGTSGHLTWSRLRAMQRAGHEIAGHTLHHLRLTTLSAAHARHEICADRTALRAHGFAATDFAYPYGAYDYPLIRAVRACGYRTGRAISGVLCPGCPFAEPLPLAHPFATRTPQAILADSRPTDIHQEVAGAQAHSGGWVQLVFHHVCDRCARYSITPRHLAGLLAWLRHRRGILVRTVAQTSSML